jgi:hypothetical protein
MTENLGPRTPNNDMVICPACTCQFVAIPVNVQARLAEAVQLLVDALIRGRRKELLSGYWVEYVEKFLRPTASADAARYAAHVEMEKQAREADK